MVLMKYHTSWGASKRYRNSSSMIIFILITNEQQRNQHYVFWQELNKVCKEYGALIVSYIHFIIDTASFVQHRNEICTFNGFLESIQRSTFSYSKSFAQLLTKLSRISHPNEYTWSSHHRILCSTDQSVIHPSIQPFIRCITETHKRTLKACMPLKLETSLNAIYKSLLNYLCRTMHSSFGNAMPNRKVASTTILHDSPL